MTMIQTIAWVILIGLAFIGSIQVFRFLRGRYLRLIAFYENLKEVFRIVNSGKQIFEAKMRIPTKQEAVSNVTSEVSKVSETTQETENVLQSTEMSIPEEIVEETFFIALDMEGKEYNSSDELTLDELVLMGNTLSNRNAAMEDKVAASQTLCKIRNTKILTALSAVAAQQVKALVADLMPPSKIISKEGDFDYSQYIKT